MRKTTSKITMATKNLWVGREVHIRNPAKLVGSAAYKHATEHMGDETLRRTRRGGGGGGGTTQ